MKKTPLRTCVVTRETLAKESLLRIVKNKQGEILVDESQSLSGRGCYIKKDKTVILKAKKNHSIEKGLKCKLDSSFYDELLKKIGG